MNESNLYYTPPSDELFEEMKARAILIWSRYDDEHGYASGKINRIKDIENVSDNFMFILAMFDQPNQRKVLNRVSIPTACAVYDRLVAGGMDEINIKQIMPYGFKETEK